MMAFRFLDGLFRRDGNSGAAIPAPDPALLRGAFDPDFYAAQLGAQPAGIDLLAHFMSRGWRDGLDPSAGFSVEGYLALNPDVAAAGLNPLAHYLQFGAAEGRVIRPSARAGLTAAPATPDADSGETARLEAEAGEIAGDLDAAFYSVISGLGFASARDAALHYLRTGWRRDLDPNPDFSTSAYLRHYPDVAEAGLPPLLHYVQAGRAEGRIARDQTADFARVLTETPDLAAMETAWGVGREGMRPLDAEAGTAALRAALRDRAGRLIIAFTHDDYRANRGGVQLCVGREAAIAASRGIDYLALYPARPRPRMAPDPADAALFAVIGDRRIGPLGIDSLRALVGGLAGSRTIDIVLHALLGHAPEHVASLAGAAGIPAIHAWLHDATFLCPNFALQRNLGAYCGAPPPASSACRMCLFGEERTRHLDRLQHLARELRIHALAPSEAAARMIAGRSDLPFADITVIPHATLAEDRGQAALAALPDAPATIAFVGAPVRHKGYPAFRDLLRRNLGRADLRFLYFGAAGHREAGMTTIAVDVTAQSPDAMIEALRREKVDFVVHWANLQETFSFSTYEAILAGADVLTHPGTGNVAALVAQTGRGHILADTAALAGFLDPGNLARALARRRAPRHPFTATQSTLSFAALDARRAAKPGRRGTTSRTRRAGPARQAGGRA